MDDLGAETELVELGDQDLGGGKTIPLPPVLQGTLGKDPEKKTLLVYGHLDVQPALKVGLIFSCSLRLCPLNNKSAEEFRCLECRAPIL